jgi:hypothetical protein
MPTYTPMNPGYNPASFLYHNRMQQGRMAQTSPPENIPGYLNIYLEIPSWNFLCSGIGGRPLQMQPNRQRQGGDYGANEHMSMNSMHIGDQPPSYGGNYNKRYNNFNV